MKFKDYLVENIFNEASTEDSIAKHLDSEKIRDKKVKEMKLNYTSHGLYSDGKKNYKWDHNTNSFKEYSGKVNKLHGDILNHPTTKGATTPSHKILNRAEHHNIKKDADTGHLVSSLGNKKYDVPMKWNDRKKDFVVHDKDAINQTEKSKYEAEIKSLEKRIEGIKQKIKDLK